MEGGVNMGSSVTVPNITEPLQQGITQVVAEGLSAVGVIFPAVMGLVGAIVVWRLGIRLFRSAVT